MDQHIAPAVRLAPAKINLALHVIGARDDGYHHIESLVVFTRFGDRLSVELAGEDDFVVTGPHAGAVPADSTNLVLRARDHLRHVLGGVSAPVRITLEKNLPVASGIGSGSSDAAAALEALAGLWAPGTSRDILHEAGLSLGADVPMCLAAAPLIASGIGEALSPVRDFPALALVLVNSGSPVSTADVFQRLERRDNAALPPLPARFDFHTIRNWLDVTRNDLEAAARAVDPAIGAVLSALDRAGSGFSRMSGSGGTCFGLFETNNVAKRAAAAIRGQHPQWFVAATRSIPSEAEN